MTLVMERPTAATPLPAERVADGRLSPAEINVRASRASMLGLGSQAAHIAAYAPLAAEGWAVFGCIGCNQVFVDAQQVFCGPTCEQQYATYIQLHRMGVRLDFADLQVPLSVLKVQGAGRSKEA